MLPGAVEAITTQMKRAVLVALRARVIADLEAVTESQKKTQEGATHEEARAEGTKDMRSTETSYLARGLAQRVSDLRNAVTRLATFTPRRFGPDDPIAVGALVLVVDEDDVEECYFLAPAGGGVKLDVGGRQVRVLTTEAPLARALRGKGQGDDLEVRTGRGSRVLEIVEVC